MQECSCVSTSPGEGGLACLLHHLELHLRLLLELMLSAVLHGLVAEGESAVQRRGGVDLVSQEVADEVSCAQGREM